MTIERKGALTNSFVSGILPWIVGGVGLLVYGLTLNRWISLLSVGTVTRVSKWSWRPELGQPLTFILLTPFRWLPEPAIPLALNIFTAVCAAMVLVPLARSVALLPHDLTRDDPLRRDRPVSVLSTPTAWMPPVLATIVCGLQLSFWEHATSASGEMIDLLVFAYVLRCLLEFGVHRDQTWFSRCALVYGAGIANNWAMAGYLPVFLAAVLRTNGLAQSLNRRLWLRLMLWGSAGLSLYLLLPALQSLSPHGQMGFWTALKIHLQSQKNALVALQTPTFRLLTLASLLPLLILSIRWKSHTVQLGDDTRLGVFLTKATSHLMHGLFLAVFLWMALDPTFGPRHLGLKAPLLTYYYVSALAVGYCAGYFLLIGSSSSPSQRLARMPVYAAGVLLGILPLALLWRNLGQLSVTNGPAVHEFARQLCADLPGGNCVALSEDVSQLLLLRAELGAQHREKECILLDTASLSSAQYQMLMAGQFKSRWPVAPPTNRLDTMGPFKIRDLVGRFATQEPVVYLHPSSGLLCEPFVDEPQGSIHHLIPVPVEDLPGRVLAEDIVATNEHIWQQRWRNSLKTLAGHTRSAPEYPLAWARPLLVRLRLAREPNFTAIVLGNAYSKSLNYWGVEMQRLGRWTEAGVWFQRALELNPDNLAARINLVYNERWRRGDKERLDSAAIEFQFREQFARFGNWGEVLGTDGPLDEPTFLFKTARVWLPGGSTRQALRGFARCADLAPDWPMPKLWLAGSYLRLGQFAKALDLTDHIQDSSQSLDGTGVADLLYCRATALWNLSRTNEATACIKSFVIKYGEQDDVLSKATDLYLETGEPVEALALVNELVRRNPNRAGLLAKKGFVQLRLARYDAAMATLTQALSLAPSDEEARWNRANASLNAGELDAARSDYEELLKTAARPQAALFGLGGIAWRRHDTNAAVQFYRQFLSNGIPDSPQYELAAKRLRQLNSGAVP